MGKFIDDEPFTLPKLICNNCKNYNGWEKCNAFPKGIPDMIFEANEHSTPLPGQVSDYIYEPKKK